uniref:Ddb1 and cul4 associated factor 17 n=2 Tax=Paramormyrops kingsleyae TaxID=1676925 RepID=A0A3B3RTJ7_9TELE|nr:DDB1- and CUL4-associated factor 17 isoform X2 [Paramormyrops kingsleyae]
MATLSTRCSKYSPTPICLNLARPQVLMSANASVHMSLRSIGAFSTDAGMLLRKNMRLLRQLILKDTTEFKKVWTRHSKSPIAYESGKIYFENYRCCFSSIPSNPQFLYELPKVSNAEKIEDALLCQCPLEKALPQSSDQKPCLLALTANNWLYRYSTKTGEQLQKVYLSPRYKFRYLGWDVPQETFYIKSVQNKPSVMARQAGLDNNTIIYLAVLSVFPLEVLAVLEINKKAFGATVVDVLLSQGLLVISHSTKVVKLYSFENIVDKYMTKRLKLGQHCEWGRVTGTVGESPFGIPVNLQINEHPPVLFELACLDNNIQIGGHPWHVIYTPKLRKHQGTYHICSLEDGSLAHNGIQDMQCCSLESDWIYFHPDDSGRIIHVGPSRINVLKILKAHGSSSQFEVVEEFSITAHRNNSAVAQPSVTFSGRTVKRRYQELDDDPEKETFKVVEYEDELDLLAAVEVTVTDEVGRAYVGLYDNQNGTLRKKSQLLEAWDVTYSHEFFFDRDTMIHIAQEKSNFCCHVYKITHRQEDIEEQLEESSMK